MTGRRQGASPRRMMSEKGEQRLRHYHWPDALTRRNVSLVSCVLIYY